MEHWHPFILYCITYIYIYILIFKYFFSEFTHIYLKISNKKSNFAIECYFLFTKAKMWLVSSILIYLKLVNYIFFQWRYKIDDSKILVLSFNTDKKDFYSAIFISDTIKKYGTEDEIVSFLIRNFKIPGLVMKNLC